MSLDQGNNARLPNGDLVFRKIKEASCSANSIQPSYIRPKRTWCFGKSRMPRILHSQWVPGIEKTECNASNSTRQNKVPYPLNKTWVEKVFLCCQDVGLKFTKGKWQAHLNKSVEVAGWNPGLRKRQLNWSSTSALAHLQPLSYCWCWCELINERGPA